MVVEIHTIIFIFLFLNVAASYCVHDNDIRGGILSHRNRSILQERRGMYVHM